MHFSENYTTRNNYIFRRKVLIIVEFIYLFSGIASTLVKGVLRLILSIIGNLLNIFRVDKPVISG